LAASDGAVLQTFYTGGPFQGVGGWATSTGKYSVGLSFSIGLSITRGAPRLRLFEKWLAELLAF